MSVQEKLHTALSELEQVAALVPEAQLLALADACMGSKRIFFSGMGRSGNMVKALAIRYMHLGFEAYVAGDASTPSIDKGDLLVAVTSSAKTKVTLNHIEVAKKVEARVALLSAADTDPLGVNCYVCIPARTRVPSVQHAGSLFEQAVLIVGDAVSSYIQEKKGIPTEYMNHRHANLQ